jgi:hypothetical protein
VHLRSACSVRELLCGQLGIDPDYLRDRVQTIFLNSKAVDDPSRATVVAGSTVALSAAMPGLAGAMLRKGSRYSPLRSLISHHGEYAESPAGQEGDATVRLFNMLQDELGPGLLQRGIRVSGEALRDLLRRRQGSLMSAILSAEMDGNPLPVPALLDVDWKGRQVRLQATSATDGPPASGRRSHRDGPNGGHSCA